MDRQTIDYLAKVCQRVGVGGCTYEHRQTDPDTWYLRIKDLQQLGTLEQAMPDKLYHRLTVYINPQEKSAVLC